MKRVYGTGTAGGRTGGVHITAVGINQLVKLAKNITEFNKEVTIKFREINKTLKAPLAEDLKACMKLSCNKKAQEFKSKARALLWIGNSIDVISGGSGPGISSLQVIVTNKQVEKFAKIYNEGGTIIPKVRQYLTVPTWQLKTDSFGLPLSYDRTQTPENIIGLLQSKGVKTFTVQLKGSDNKLILGRVENDTIPSEKNKNIPLFLLTKAVVVEPTYWAKAGMFTFINGVALPRIINEGKVIFKRAKENLLNVT